MLIITTSIIFFQMIPWYNLPKLNRLVSDRVNTINTSRVYRKGYLSAAFNN